MNPQKFWTGLFRWLNLYCSALTQLWNHSYWKQVYSSGSIIVVMLLLGYEETAIENRSILVDQSMLKCSYWMIKPQKFRAGLNQWLHLNCRALTQLWNHSYWKQVYFRRFIHAALSLSYKAAAFKSRSIFKCLLCSALTEFWSHIC